MAAAGGCCKDLTIYTIGHSNHPWERFVELLRRHKVDLVVDVRSHPVARYAVHFSEPRLRPALTAIGIGYDWMGTALGGRRQDLLDASGRRDTDAYHENPTFLKAITDVLKLAAERTVCLLCSEEDPAKCHRHKIIARWLMQRRSPSVQVLHIRGDGRLQAAEDVGYAEQGKLFG